MEEDSTIHPQVEIKRDTSFGWNDCNKLFDKREGTTKNLTWSNI